MTDALVELQEELRNKILNLEERKVRSRKFQDKHEAAKKQLEQLTALLKRDEELNNRISTSSQKYDDTELGSDNAGGNNPIPISAKVESGFGGSNGDRQSTGFIRSIVILMAMEQEARPFLERHHLVENIPSPFVKGSPMISYSGRVTTQSGETVMVHLIWNGRCKIHSCNLVATTAAGVAAYAALQVFHPDLVISAGTAGGFSELGACIGDVYLSTKCIFHARRIPLCLPSKDEGCGFKVKHFEEYGFGHFRSPPLNHLAKTVGVKQGIVSSSDCLDCSEIDLQLLRSEGAVVKEMEAAAVAWVCQVLGTPFFALKSITDIVDGSIDSEEEFYSNLSLASVNLQEKLTLVVRHLGGTTLNGSNMSVPHVKQTSVKQHRALEDSSNVNLAIRDSFDTESGGFFRHTAYAFIAIGTCMSFYMTYYKSR